MTGPWLTLIAQEVPAEGGVTFTIVLSIAGVAVLLAIILAIAFWPKDNSF